eukprot:355915-Chlamydomonas_euryale.AAC.16
MHMASQHERKESPPTGSVAAHALANSLQVHYHPLVALTFCRGLRLDVETTADQSQSRNMQAAWRASLCKLTCLAMYCARWAA